MSKKNKLKQLGAVSTETYLQRYSLLFYIKKNGFSYNLKIRATVESWSLILKQEKNREGNLVTLKRSVYFFSSLNFSYIKSEKGDC